MAIGRDDLSQDPWDDDGHRWRSEMVGITSDNDIIAFASSWISCFIHNPDTSPNILMSSDTRWYRLSYWRKK